MFLVIDQGTTSTKVVLFDTEGKKIDVSQKSFKQIFPENGWVEHNPKEIIETVINCCNEIIDRNPDKKISHEQIPIIIITHETTKKHLKNVLAKIEKLDFVLEGITVITIDHHFE